MKAIDLSGYVDVEMFREEMEEIRDQMEELKELIEQTRDGMKQEAQEINQQLRTDMVNKIDGQEYLIESIKEEI